MSPEFIGYGHSHFPGDILAHRHQDSEIVFLVRGDCTHRIENVDYPASPGSIMFIPANTNHQEQRTGAVETRYVIFRNTDMITPEKPVLIDTVGDRLIESWLKDLETMQSEREQEQRNALLAALLNRIVLVQEQTTAARHRHPALNKAIALLEQKLAQPITVAQLSRLSHVSTSYLNALFNHEFGFGPSKYLLRLRMAKARLLLGDPYLSVAEISVQCGLDQPAYFCRIFKKFHRRTPGQFRKQIFSQRSEQY